MSRNTCRPKYFLLEAKRFLSFFLIPDIFQEAGLPLWLRPYEVLVTSSYTALIETIPDTVNLDVCFLSGLNTR